MRPGWSRKLKLMTASHDADGDAGDERARERHHAGDDRGGQGADERARAEGGEVRAAEPVWPAMSDSDSVASAPGDRPDERRDQPSG